jgi:uncharacterized protein
VATVTNAPQSVPRYPGVAPIDAYGNGGFRFAGMSHRGSILCLPYAIEAWEPTSVDGLTPASFAPVFAAKDQIDFVLLGTGEMHRRPSADVRAAFSAAGLGLDVMGTGAAARTYNVLIAEGRRVAAALIATGRAPGN